MAVTRVDAVGTFNLGNNRAMNVNCSGTQLTATRAAGLLYFNGWYNDRGFVAYSNVNRVEFGEEIIDAKRYRVTTLFTPAFWYQDGSNYSTNHLKPNQIVAVYVRAVARIWDIPGSLTAQKYVALFITQNKDGKVLENIPRTPLTTGSVGVASGI
jgi:hypothetical protein